MHSPCIEPVASDSLHLVSTQHILQHTTALLTIDSSGYDGAPKLQATLRSLRQQLSIPPDQPLPIGAGFIGWVGDRASESEGDVLSTILEEHPKAIWLSFGIDLGKYVRRIREHNKKYRRNVLVFLQATSLEEALEAVNELKVDVLVVQGKNPWSHTRGIILTHLL